METLTEFISNYHFGDANFWKSTAGVNFTNILLKRFSYESKMSSFLLLRFSFVIFGAKILYKKRVRKTLMKLMAGFLNRERESLDKNVMKDGDIFSHFLCKIISMQIYANEFEAKLQSHISLHHIFKIGIYFYQTSHFGFN